MVQDLKVMQAEMGLMPVRAHLEEAEVVLDSREQRDRRVLQEMAEMDIGCLLHQSCIPGSLVEEAVH
jgi:CO dehydrogenase/acetyl-CoA synthase beta subunit